MINPFHTKVVCELPLDFLKNNECSFMDCLVCDFHDFLNREGYKEFFQQTPKEVILKGEVEENELDKYWEVINSIPTLIYYYLPEGFEKNIYKRGIPFKMLPILRVKGDTLTSLSMEIKKEIKDFPQAIVAINSSEKAFDNKNNTVGYFNEKDIPVVTIRSALNRKMFMRGITIDCKNIKFILDDCESLIEFDDWASYYDNSNIIMVNSNQPLYCSLHLGANYSSYDDGFCTDGDRKIASYYAKFPEPENWKDKKASDFLNTKFLENFKEFKSKIHHWEY